MPCASATAPAGVCIHELRGCTARLNLVRGGHRGVIEEQNEVVLLRVALGLNGSIGPGGKARHRLLFIVLEDLEIFPREVADVISFFVGHYGIDQHQTRFFFDNDAGLLFRRGSRSGGSRGGRRLLLRCSLSCKTLRRPAQNRKRRAHCGKQIRCHSRCVHTIPQ